MAKIIVFAHTKGGVGKSTLAWNVASAMREHGTCVDIFDLDYQKTLFFVNKLRMENLLNVSVFDNKSKLEGALSKTDSAYILIDIGGFDSELNRFAIKKADMVICPLKDSVHEVLGFYAFANVARQIGTPHIHFCINAAHPKNIDFSELKNAMGAAYKNSSFLSSIVRYRAAFARAMSVGKGVTELTNPHFLKAATEINALTREILEATR